jgi:hypothetical protein
MDRKSNFALFLFCLIVPAILLFPVFSSICLAKVVTLGWDANPEPDLEGYIIYRNVGSPGPPYKFSSTLPEDDLSNPLVPEVKLTGLKEETEYFVAVTAYDTEGNESYFSDEICVEIVDSIIENCSASLSSGATSNSNSGSSGSGGNSGTCFIDSTAGDLNYVALFGVIFVLVLGAFKAFTFFLDRINQPSLKSFGAAGRIFRINLSGSLSR